MEITLLREGNHYKIYTTRHISPFDNGTDDLMYLLEHQADEGWKLNGIFFYKMELLIIFERK